MYWLVPCISPLPKSEASCAPGIGGDVDAASQRAAHVGGDLPDGVHLHRVRDEECRAVRPCHRPQAPRGSNRAVVFQRGNLDVEPLTLYLARADPHRTRGIVLPATAAKPAGCGLTVCQNPSRSAPHARTPVWCSCPATSAVPTTVLSRCVPAIRRQQTPRYSRIGWPSEETT